MTGHGEESARSLLAQFARSYDAGSEGSKVKVQSPDTYRTTTGHGCTKMVQFAKTLGKQGGHAPDTCPDGLQTRGPDIVSGPRSGVIGKRHSVNDLGRRTSVRNMSGHVSAAYRTDTPSPLGEGVWSGVVRWGSGK